MSKATAKVSPKQLREDDQESVKKAIKKIASRALLTETILTIREKAETR